MLTSHALPAMFRAEPIGEHSRHVYALRHHALLAIPPGNAYYTGARIAQLARWAFATFDQVHLFTWEEPYAWWSLAALGDAEDWARHKAHRAFRNMVNRARRALVALRRDPDRHMITWPTLTASEEYAGLRGEVERAFRDNEAFGQAVRAAAEDSLYRHALELHGQMPWRERVDAAARYVRAELPLCLDGARILRVPSSVYVYHQPGGALYERLFAGDFDPPGRSAGPRPAARQGRLTVTALDPPTSAERPGAWASTGPFVPQQRTRHAP